MRFNIALLEAVIPAQPREASTKHRRLVGGALSPDPQARGHAGASIAMDGGVTDGPRVRQHIVTGLVPTQSVVDMARQPPHHQSVPRGSRADARAPSGWPGQSGSSPREKRW